MTSSVDDFSIPEFCSTEQNEGMSEDCRLEKDSSNDVDMYEDSSGEESVEATCGLKNNGIVSASTYKAVKTKEYATGDSKSLVSLNRSSITFDEETLMKMNDGEQDFFDNYKKANYAQMSSLKCTTCACQLFLVNRENIRVHPVLGVLVCKSCREFYSNGPFTKDENGHDEYCRWCAEGGIIICCDTCTNVFCKACLRRCLGRVNLLDITSSKNKWSCLVCNNLPLWSQRALCRMVMSAVKSTPGRKSLSRRSLQSASVSSDPSIWLPAVINEAEKLATYCKALASKVGASWSKETAETGGGPSIQNKERVINYCRKLRKAVVTTRVNMKLLEEKIVCKFEQNYGDTDDIEVDQHESSILKPESTSRTGKRLIVKIKNFREANSKQDYYAEVRESSPPFSVATSLKTHSPHKSVCSLSSQATIPHFTSPLPTEEQSDNSNTATDAEPQVKEAEKNPSPTVDDLLVNDESVEFFDTYSHLIEENEDVLQERQTSSVESDHNVSLENFPSKLKTTKSNSRLSNTSPDMFAHVQADDDSDFDDTAETVPLDHIQPKSEANFEKVDVKREAKISTTPTPSAGSSRESPCVDTPSLTAEGNKSFVSKLSRSTPSSKKRASKNLPGSSDVVVDTTLVTSTPGKNQSTKSHKSAASQVGLNEKARQELLRDSCDSSDDSLAELKLSPRVKMTKKRSRLPLGLEDDPKLNAECAVVVNRITNLNELLSLENGLRMDSEELTLKKQVDRLIKNPITISANNTNAESDDSDPEIFDRKSDELKNQHKRPKNKKPVTKSFPLSDSESSSPPDTEFQGLEDTETTEITGVTKLLTTLSSSIPDRNEAARRDLLASDSDSDIEMDTKETENIQDEVPESAEENVIDEFDVMDHDDNGIIELKEEVVGQSTDEEGSVKVSNIKTDKLLRMSLGDPDAESDSKKSHKGKEAKKDKKKTKERKKRRIQSDSDFESSDSEKEKKKGKKKHTSPSDDEPSDDDDSSKDKVKSKRRRIKKVAKSSESENSNDSDIEILNESQRSETGVKGRKNIKKIMKDTSLKDETKAAAKEEEDRKRRIAERQRFYNEAFVGDMALINAQTHHLVLDFDPKNKKELVTVDKKIVTKLKPHQVKGVKFMWDACFESIERIKEHPGSGCILAHCMGLGKSLQVVTLVHTVLTNKACQVDRVLVVCPLSTVLNWVNEFNVWLPPNSNLEIYEMTSAKGNNKDLRMYTLRNWLEGGGVMIIGYDMYRNLVNENNKKTTKKERDVFTRSLVDPGPQLVVCDEGHLLKNEKTALSKSMNKIATRRRIVLTGTPLQNSLLEYHCMIQFVKPNLLGTVREFTNRFANPIKNGQAADSTDSDVRVMKRRAHVLHKMLEDSVQRFDYAVLTPFLPPKHEYVVSVKLSELQIKMYQYYLEFHAKGGPNHIGRGKGAGLFADFQELGRVWTHPKAMLLAELNREAKAKNNDDSEDSMVDFIDDRGDTPVTDDDAGVVCLDESGDEKETTIPKPSFRMRTRATRGDQPLPEEELGVTTPMSSTWWSQFVQEEDMIKMEHSGKLVLLMDILRQCELIGDKVLVFSQSLVSLNLIEEFLSAEDEKNEKNRASLASTDLKHDPIGTWRINQDYFRLDGQTSAELRKNACNTFNSPSNLRSRLFLISTKAGGLGINLVAANRVIIFDASWNPSHDVQSIFRVYRFGQKKPCYIYRFLAQGTMEEKIYDRQVTKLSLSCRVVDEQQIERHFNSADLNELYIFEPDSHLRRPTPLLPKDRLLAELTIQRKDWIVTYHEHDSLLENKSEEELTEAERKAAWDDFENEKRGVNPMMGMMMNEMPGFAAMPGMSEILVGLAGRSVAGIPLTNIAAMIYNSNPGINQDEFLGRLRLTVDQLQNFSVQQAAAASAAAAAASAQSAAALQQPGDAQRLMMQRQVAADQLKRQFGNAPQSPGLAGPSGLGAPVAMPRSRGRPTIGPHQRTDLYGMTPLYNPPIDVPPGSSQPAGPSGSNSVPKT